VYPGQDHGDARFHRHKDPVYLAAFLWGPDGRTRLSHRTFTLFLEFLAQQWILASALAVAVIMLFYHESRKSGQSLSPQQAINLVNRQDGVFVDLRDSKEFGQGHIVDALNIPASKLDGRVAELEKYRDKPIVLVCKMGQNSGAAGKTLKAKGFSQVFRMSGGMMEWGTMQLPLVK